MAKWIIKGLKTGVVTTPYPKKQEVKEGVTSGRPQDTAGEEAKIKKLISVCPTGALQEANGKVIVEHSKCVHCYRCLRSFKEGISWDSGFEWAYANRDFTQLPKAFSNSVHIRVFDGGGCGACVNEVKLLNNPFYNMHRLGFFITPTPRKADVLLVVGPVTEHMKTALLKTYDAMPTPKRVMAVGTCALNGGVFENSFVVNKLEDLLPVDVKIPGCPPPPLAIIHGLLVVAGRKYKNKYDGYSLLADRKEEEKK